MGLKFLGAFAVCIAICCCAAIAKEDAKGGQKLSVETKEKLGRMRLEQQKLLHQLRVDFARLGAPPEKGEFESEEDRAHRTRIRELLFALRELEDRVNLDLPVRTVFVSWIDDREPLKSYYKRASLRIEREGTSRFPKANGKSIYGSATLLLTFRKDGRIDGIEALEPSSNVVSARAIALVRSLAPFEPFPADAAKLADRIVVGVRFHFSRDD